MTTMPADGGEEEKEEEEAPPAIPPRRPPRPSRETRNSYSRSATLELPSHRSATSRNYPPAALIEGCDDCSDYENDPRSLPEVCVVYNAGQQQQEQERTGAISRP